MKAAHRSVLIVLESFLALTAIGGGIGLLTGAGAPPVEMLANSPFSGYVIPGLALLVLVGGIATVSAVLLVRKHPQATLWCGISAVSILVFETVEVLSIGSPEGVARSLQILYFVVGVLIGGISLLAGNQSTSSTSKNASLRDAGVFPVHHDQNPGKPSADGPR